MRLESTLEMWYSYTGEKDKAHAERSVWAFLVEKTAPEAQRRKEYYISGSLMDMSSGYEVISAIIFPRIMMI